MDIKALAREAGIDVDDCPFVQGNWWACAYKEEFEAFARLIAEECAKVCVEKSDYCGGQGGPRCPSGRELAQAIRDKFGNQGND